MTVTAYRRKFVPLRRGDALWRLWAGAAILQCRQQRSTVESLLMTSDRPPWFTPPRATVTRNVARSTYLLQFVVSSFCNKSTTSMSVLLIVDWPRRVLPPGDSRPVCLRDSQTDGRTPDRYTTLFAGRSQRNKSTRNPQQSELSKSCADRRVTNDCQWIKCS